MLFVSLICESFAAKGNIMRQEQAKVENHWPVFSQPSATSEPTQRLELVTLLQTTLAPERLLELFSRKISAWLPHDGLKFSNQEAGIEVNLGKEAPHQCCYRLTLEERELGEIRLLRRKRFSEQELEQFEDLLCCLVYPLRNALLYCQAVQSTYTDPLTGLYNRAALQNAFAREWKLAGRLHAPLSVLVLDIDHFKAINDAYGHLVGDEVLVRVAACLKETVRASDLLFRYGGEEFVILLHAHLRGAKLLAERVRLAIRSLDFTEIAQDLSVTASLGVASYAPEESPEQLLKRADDALYQAKRQGRDRVVIASQPAQAGAPDTT
jgi:diguanylate cyclase (GGDEF)-like protein